MCLECWQDSGSPTVWNEQVARAAELIEELYTMHAVGGPLHVVVDDWNLDGTIVPYYECYDDEELDALWNDGQPLSELDPAAPVAIEGIGHSMRQVCDELAALFNAMPLEQRYSAMAYSENYLPRPVAP